MLISALERYLFFFMSLVLCGIIPSSFRSTYLYGVTALLWSSSLIRGTCDLQLSLITASGLAHSAVHICWPFLNETVEGFDYQYSALPDVFFHATMLAFVWAITKSSVCPYVHIWTTRCIFGAMLNCLFTVYQGTGGYLYIIFNITSIFQAISTAFWIAASIHYGEWGKDVYKLCLGLVNAVIVTNWAFYELDHWGGLQLGLVGFSMKYRYIEALFICCTWVPLLLCQPLNLNQ